MDYINNRLLALDSSSTVGWNIKSEGNNESRRMRET